MVTFNVVNRVFRILHNGKTASSYTIEKGECQYLVSASHVFEGCESVTELEIFHDDKWKKIPVAVVFNSLDVADTIVFKLENDLSPRFEIEHGVGGVIYGSWAYFLGFPLGMKGPGSELTDNYPVPFIKAGLVSCIYKKGEGLNVIYLDGHNNKGFSGGPAVWVNPTKPTIMQIIGTVSHYITEPPISTETKESISMYGTNAGLVEVFSINDIFQHI